MKSKLQEISQAIPWVERLDSTCDPAADVLGTEKESGEDVVHDDFKREMRFYRQAQTTVLESIPRLHSLGIPTSRPEDYFAQMAKADEHMTKVREKLLAKQVSMDRSEKAKKLRELRKFGKKVQHEVLQKRQKEKREMLDAVKKYRKGQDNKLDFLESGKQKIDGNKKQIHQPGKKRQFKNKKFGFGGQKKRSKYNTSKSAKDMSDFSVKKHATRPGGVKKAKAASKNRPGKRRRQKGKNK
ncbi:probable rRNA-processing protein EBP2 isoform X2 [Lingula anatina]|nr:probable rRNA-processing protein EBP2 isoform X2 [Lingula anatina]|eukprot:XP_023930259.1 probable rRNA-processing protein EBP2 isoform X2 [Lingula anatina]